MHFLLNAQVGESSGIGESLKNVFSSFSVRDVIDIILLGLILFIAFSVLKGRKARALLAGIAICIVLLAVAKIFDLKALDTIFSGIVESGTIVIIIIFQPEIREALEKIGGGSIDGIMSFSDRRKKKELFTSAIDNICEAVDEMSSESTGALIVIERSNRLSDIISTGVTINANVNSLLIRNLFVNRAPLHDGAVIVSSGRIAAAGCLLPLTTRTDIDSALGTRHRAALGMSEASDAVVIVVSEETGKISIAYDGKLVRGVQRDVLKAFLLENLLKISFDPTKKDHESDKN